MAKSTKTVYIDSELIDIIKLRKINLSMIINEYLKYYLEIERKLPDKKEQLKKEIEEDKIKLQAKESLLKQFEENEPKETILPNGHWEVKL